MAISLNTIEEIIQALEQLGPLVDIIKGMFHQSPGVTINPGPSNTPTPAPPVATAPPVTVTVTPVDPGAKPQVSLSVMTIRDGRDGSPQDVSAILSGAAALMSHFKVKFDSGDAGMGQADAGDVIIRASYDGVLDLVVEGDGTVTQEGKHWSAANTGNWSKAGYAFVLKMNDAGGGSHTAQVEVIHSGIKSNSIAFPRTQDAA